MNKMLRETVLRDAKEVVNSSKKYLSEFAGKLQNMPAHTLYWGDQAFQQAATLEVMEICIGMIESGSSLEQVRDYCYRAAYATALTNTRSTSACADLIDRFRGAAYARAVDFMASYI